MLNGFFVFNEIGNLLYDKVFFEEMDDEKLEMFQSFLVALKTFIAGMKFDGSSTLRAINLGDYHVEINHILEINSELVIVTDMEDDKSANKMIPQIVEVIINNKDLFNESERTSEQFQKFDDDVNKLIRSSKKSIDEKLLDQKVDIFRSIWAQRGEISVKLREELQKNKDNLLINLGSEQNLLIKSKIFEELLEILEKLNDTANLLSYQKVAKEVKDEIKDRRIKLKYYLGRAKESLKNKDYNAGYMNFYSFSTKLKNMAKPLVQKKYYNFANVLSNKESVEFKQTVSEILIMPNNIEEYFV